MKNSTVDTSEIAKFSLLAQQWWDKNGPLKTLHDINPTRLEFIKQFTPLSGKKVLDVGCGGGILTESLAEEGAHVQGLDAEVEVINTAIDHAKTNKLSIKYIASPLETFESAPFDVITCMEMLEHVTDPAQIIHDCARLLKPGGYVFLSTINRNILAYGSVILAAEYILGILPKQTHDYKKFIKPSELAYLARDAGLEVVGLQGLSYNPFSRIAGLQKEVDVNYLMACHKII